MSDKYAALKQAAETARDNLNPDARFKTVLVLELLAERDADRARIAELELRLSQQQSVASNNLDMFRRADARVAELEARIEPLKPIAWIVHARTGDQLTQNGDYVANAEGMANIHSTPLYAAPLAQPVAVPDGYALVPVDPTPAMMAEICLVEGWTERALKARYQAMLAAAPGKEG